MEEKVEDYAERLEGVATVAEARPGMMQVVCATEEGPDLTLTSPGERGLIGTFEFSSRISDGLL